MLERTFRTGSPVDGSTEPRQVVLIANGIGNDIHVLGKLGLMPDLKDFPDMIIVDTGHIYKRLFKARKSPSLVSMLDFLHIPYRFDHLHSGGNDANLTLKVFIMLIVISCKEHNLSSKQEKIEALLLLIACEEAPETPSLRKQTTKDKIKAQRKEAKENEFNVWAENDDDGGAAFCLES